MNYEYEHNVTKERILLQAPIGNPPKAPKGYTRVYSAAVYAEGIMRNKEI